MAKIGIFYGSNTGYTADVAVRISEKMDVARADVYDVAGTAPSKLGEYDIIVIGSSTWGDGDMENDMADFIDGAQALDLKGKKIAIFGCGDETMTDTFCNAVGEIYRRLQPTGAEFIAPFNADGYTFTHTGAMVDGKIVGMVIDDVNHPELTDEKIDLWIEEIKRSL